MIWIIGTGYLGSRLAVALRREHWNLLCIDIRSPLADACADAASAGQMDDLLAKHGSPRLIISCCATQGGDLADYRHSYLDLQRNLARLSEKMPRKARLIFCSSSSVYGGQNGEEMSEQSAPKASHPRAQILLESEAVVLAQGGIVLRLAALYGKARCALLTRFLSGEMPLAGSDTRQLNYLHVDVAVEQIVQLITELGGPQGAEFDLAESARKEEHSQQIAPVAPAPSAPEAIYNLLSDQFSKGEILAYLAAQTGCAIPQGEARISKRGSSNQRLISTRMFSMNDARAYARFRRFVEEQGAECAAAERSSTRPEIILGVTRATSPEAHIAASPLPFNTANPSSSP